MERKGFWESSALADRPPLIKGSVIILPGLMEVAIDDPQLKRVTPLRLSTQEFRILHYIALKSPPGVGHDELKDVLPNTAGNAVQMQISRIREKLKQAKPGAEANLITERTENQRVYRLVD